MPARYTCRALYKYISSMQRPAAAHTACQPTSSLRITSQRQHNRCHMHSNLRPWLYTATHDAVTTGTSLDRPARHVTDPHSTCCLLTLDHHQPTRLPHHFDQQLHQVKLLVKHVGQTLNLLVKHPPHMHLPGHCVLQVECILNQACLLLSMHLRIACCCAGAWGAASVRYTARGGASLCTHAALQAGLQDRQAQQRDG
jgi:hypothetical protein